MGEPSALVVDALERGMQLGREVGGVFEVLCPTLLYSRVRAVRSAARHVVSRWLKVGVDLFTLSSEWASW
jgi:hypothetical protein